MKRDITKHNRFIYLLLLLHSFFTTRRSNISLWVALLGISVGIFSLIVIISTMNGMQKLLIDDLTHIESYDYIGRESFADRDNIVSQLEGYPQVELVIPFIDEFAFIESVHTSRILHLRALHKVKATQDIEFLQAISLSNENTDHITSVQDAQDLSHNTDESRLPGILIGWNLSSILRVSIGDIVQLSFPGEGAGFLPVQMKVRIANIFYSGSDYDTQWGFMSLEDYAAIQKEIQYISYGVRIHSQRGARNILETQLESVSSWEENNSAFYVALKTEKVILILLSTVIFCVIILHFKFAMTRRIRNKKDDIVALRTMGVLPSQIKKWFLGETVIIGCIGTIIGVLLAMLFTYSYPYLYEWIFSTFGIGINIDNITSGYIGNIEFIWVISFTWISLLWVSTLVVKKISQITPMQVLRYE